MASDDYAAIQVWRHPTSGTVIYLPIGQALPDTVETLERDGLISCRHDAQGRVHARMRNPRHVRVVCWQLTVNADAHRQGHADVFNVPADLYEKFPGALLQ